MVVSINLSICQLCARLGDYARLLKTHDEIKNELIEAKSQVVVAEYKRETEIQHQDRRAQEEIASLQQLVHGMIKIQTPATNENYSVIYLFSIAFDFRNH